MMAQNVPKTKLKHVHKLLSYIDNIFGKVIGVVYISWLYIFWISSNISYWLFLCLIFKKEIEQAFYDDVKVKVTWSVIVYLK